jgi:hypothetical protein
MTDLTPRLLGAVPSPYDERDHPLSAHYVLPAGIVLPDRSRSLGIPNPPYNQDGGKCVGFSAAGDATIEETPEAGGQVRFDADELYARCKEQDGSPNTEGTNIRVAAEIRRKRGMYAVDGPNKGKLLQIASYSALNVATVDDMDAAIYSASQGIGGSPWIACSWPANWFASPGAGVLPHPGVSAGGHAIKISEYWRSHPSGRCRRLLNSWGPGWGVNGEAWVRDADLLAVLWEAWKTFDAPDPIPTPPEANMDVTKITPLDHVDMAPGGSLRDATTGENKYPKYIGAKGVGTWGKLGADNVVRVTYHAGGPIMAALYPSALCTLIVPTPGFTQADIDKAVAAEKAKAVAAVQAI